MYRRENKKLKIGWIIVFLLLAISFWLLVRGLFGSFAVDREIVVRA
jgi:hypothetical protein